VASLIIGYIWWEIFGFQLRLFKKSGRDGARVEAVDRSFR
jgi:hypothetical protein